MRLLEHGILKNASKKVGGGQFKYSNLAIQTALIIKAVLSFALYCITWDQTQFF